MKNKVNRVFVTSTSGVGEKPTCDTLKYRYGNEIDHPQSRIDNQTNKPNQITNKETKVSQIYTNS